MSDEKPWPPQGFLYMTILNNPVMQSQAGREMVGPLSSPQSLYEYRAEVIITYAFSTSDASETQAQLIEVYC
jgi:hypothetical protein